MSDPIVIRCRDNGPFVVKGPVQVVDNAGNPFPIPAGKEVVALCRCGASKVKPFCDGAHNACGFQGSEKAPQQPA
ncbi:MAG: hypothetical protein RIR17_2044 [Planctomycetota bacterium]|jgi:CDGSH-type Zn-finger protein